ncbi:MAG: hypothetical protein Ct9H90mP8_3010 [Pseudomonadota bacterium]|nr:MAG: hypothetical protein Ct9H90mP8_3010 [Pseudomonadota bacterium]
MSPEENLENFLQCLVSLLRYLREMVIKNRSILGTTQKQKGIGSSSVDMIVKGKAPREIEEKREFSMTFNLDS